MDLCEWVNVALNQLSIKVSLVGIGITRDPKLRCDQDTVICWSSVTWEGVIPPSRHSRFRSSDDNSQQLCDVLLFQQRSQTSRLTSSSARRRSSLTSPSPHDFFPNTSYLSPFAVGQLLPQQRRKNNVTLPSRHASISLHSGAALTSSRLYHYA